MPKILSSLATNFSIFYFRAESIYEEMKQKYGTQGCYLLKINSRTSNRASDEQIPDPWSQYLQKNSIQNQVYVKNNNEANHKSCISVLWPMAAL